jgi:hypothetical protein
MYIKQVLEILAKKRFHLKLSKYNFYIKKISLDPKKIRVITIWEILIIIKQI